MLNYARRIRTLDDVRTCAEGGLSPQRLRGMVDAILARLGHPLTNAGREWSSKTLLELGRDCVEARGVSLRGLSRMDVAAVALNLQRREGPRGYLATSDLPSLLANGRADPTHRRLPGGPAHVPGLVSRRAARRLPPDGQGQRRDGAEAREDS
jgi:hypothetical protein